MKKITSDKISNGSIAKRTHDNHTKKVISLFDDGYTFGEIAKQLGLNPLYVFNLIYAHLRRTVSA